MLNCKRLDCKEWHFCSLPNLLILKATVTFMSNLIFQAANIIFKSWYEHKDMCRAKAETGSVKITNCG